MKIGDRIYLTNGIYVWGDHRDPRPGLRGSVIAMGNNWLVVSLDNYRNPLNYSGTWATSKDKVALVPALEQLAEAGCED